MTTEEDELREFEELENALLRGGDQGVTAWPSSAPPPPSPTRSPSVATTSVAPRGGLAGAASSGSEEPERASASSTAARRSARRSALWVSAAPITTAEVASRGIAVLMGHPSAISSAASEQNSDAREEAYA